MGHIETPGTSCIGAVQQPVCDQSGKQHSTLCSLLQTNEKIDYMGYCRVGITGQVVFSWSIKSILTGGMHGTEKTRSVWSG